MLNYVGCVTATRKLEWKLLLEVSLASVAVSVRKLGLDTPEAGLYGLCVSGFTAWCGQEIGTYGFRAEGRGSIYGFQGYGF